MKLDWRVIGAAGVVAIGLWNCGGGGSQSLPPAQTAAQAKTSATARFVFTVPSASATAAVSRRSPAYLSASMQSLVITLSSNDQGATQLQPVYVNLTTTDPHCTGSPLTCTVNMPAFTGKNVFHVVAYDQPQSETETPAGRALSQNDLTVSIAAGTAVTVPLTLDGITTAFAAVPSGSGSLTGSVAGLTLTGSAPQNINIEPLDAAGNVIIGPGAPTVLLTGPASNITIANISGTTFSLQGIAAGSFALAATAAPLSTSVGIAPFVLNIPITYSTAGGMATPSPSPSPSPSPTAAGGSGQVFVGVSGSGVYSLAGATSSPVIAGAIDPQAIAIGRDNTLFVSNGASAITAYPNLGTSAASRSIGAGSLTTVTGIALDQTGNLYVAEAGNAAVQVFSPTATTTATRTVSFPAMTNPVSVACDLIGNLWVLDGSSHAYEFAAGTTTLIASLTSTGTATAYGLAVDTQETVYEGNRTTGIVTEFLAANGSNSHQTGIIGGYTSLTVDGSNNLLVLTTSGIQTFAKLTAGGPAGLGTALMSSGAYPFANGESIVTFPNLLNFL